MREISFIPDWVLGKGKTCKVMGATWPHIEFHESVRWYSLFQFGHHLQSNLDSNKQSGLVFHVWLMKGHGNYVELTIHHFATIFSLMYSYFTNWEDFGVFVRFVSDFADIFLNLGKHWRDTGAGNVRIYAMFATVLWAWGYTRCVILPWCFGEATIRLLPFNGTPMSSEYEELW